MAIVAAAVCVSMTLAIAVDAYFVSDVKFLGPGATFNAGSENADEWQTYFYSINK